MNYRNPKLFGGYWAIVCIVLLGILYRVLPDSRINNSVLSLLPQQISQQIPPEINEAFSARLDRQVVWMISANAGQEYLVANDWLKQLQQLPELASLRGPMPSEEQQQWGKFYYQYRNSNLDAQTRHRLSSGGEAQIQWILGQLYSAFSGVSSQELQRDPLMLVRGAQLSLTNIGNTLTLNQGWLTAQDQQGKTWFFLHGEIANSSFNMQQSHQFVKEVTTLTDNFIKRYPDAKILTRGAVFYSDHASQQAQSDMRHLGLATVVGIILLIIWVFRSLRPLVLCLLSIMIGALAGVVTVLSWWHEIHIMTLVMSMSIIGISADYTLYYLCERRVFGDTSTPWQSLSKVGKTLLLALATTVIAYATMLLAPFPGIQQMAAFSIAGLSASCLTVFCWHPWLCRGLPVSALPLNSLFFRWIVAWRHNRWINIGLPAALALLSGVGLLQLRSNDDISQLQDLPKALLAQERLITEMTQQPADQQWFLVSGPNAQATLTRLEALTPHLIDAQQAGLLSHWRAIPLNSFAQQKRDLELIKQAAPKIEQRLASIGLPRTQVDTTPMPLSPDIWLNSPASEGWRLLWLQLATGTTATLVPVSGVTDKQQLASLAQQLPGVAWVDRKTSFNDLFRHYRQLISGLIIVALGVIAVSALLRCGWRKGLVTLIPSVLSLCCGLASLALTGQPITLFSVLALNLVLGIGINYTLFFSNPQGTPLVSLQAITLAMVTTLLTMGMLLFSSTQAISSFGTVLCSGIFTAWLLSPLALPERKKKRT